MEINTKSLHPSCISVYGGDNSDITAVVAQGVNQIAPK
jgi:hypothetical protein